MGVMMFVVVVGGSGAVEVDRNRCRNQLGGEAWAWWAGWCVGGGRAAKLPAVLTGLEWADLGHYFKGNDE